MECDFLCWENVNMSVIKIGLGEKGKGLWLKEGIGLAKNLVLESMQEDGECIISNGCRFRTHLTETFESPRAWDVDHIV